MRPRLAQRARGRAGIEQVRKYVVDVLAGHLRRIGIGKNRENWKNRKIVEGSEELEESEELEGLGDTGELELGDLRTSAVGWPRVALNSGAGNKCRGAG